MSDGVLPDRELRAAVRDGWVVAPIDIEDQQFQPASLDLRLGPEAYQLRASFLPYREAVQARLDATDSGDSELVIDRVSLERGATLQRGSVYLVPLLERVALPPSVRGRCNPKSTTGRLDVFTRVITDATPRFDEVAAGYRGALYLEVSPQSFPVRVHAGHSLNQLRDLPPQATTYYDGSLAGLAAVLEELAGLPVAERARRGHAGQAAIGRRSWADVAAETATVYELAVGGHAEPAVT